MVRKRISSAPGVDRTRKRAGRRARGLEIIKRDDVWHAYGTVRAGGRSIRVRRSLGLPATTATLDAAWEELRSIEADVRGTATGSKVRGDPVAIAAQAYLTRPRKRLLAPSSVRIIKDIVAEFGPRRLNEISAAEWRSFVDKRQAGNESGTRERYLGTVCAYHKFAAEFHGLTVAIRFHRDKEARNPRQRKRRRVSELRPELIRRLLESCHISLRAQLAVEWSTGARVSSLLHGVRICDVDLTPARRQITFNATKNGDDVSAALHPSAIKVLLEYVAWRGGLHDREAPFFVTWQRRPYEDNGRAWGGQNKSGFNGARRRARRALLKEAFEAARQARSEGRRADALAIYQQARADAWLLRRMTQHWFRHLLATRMRHDLRAAMEQGGWRDERSVLGYIADVPQERRALVETFEGFDTSLTPDALGKSLKA